MFSASMVSSAANSCGYRWHLRYVRGQRRNIASRATAKGTAIHRVAETDLKARVKGNRALTEDEFVEASVEELKAIPDIHDAEKDPGLSETQLQVIELAKGWVQHVSPTINEPLEVEPHWTGQIEYQGETFSIHGYPDLVDVDPRTGEYRIRDWKTGKSFSEKTYTNGIQATMYTALAQANGYATDLLRIDHLRVLKSGPAHKSVEMRRGPKHHLQLARLVSAADKMLESDLYMPNPWGWGCNTGCEFWNECPYRAPDED